MSPARKRALILGVLWLHQVAIAVLAPLSERDWTVQIEGPTAPSMAALWHWLIVTSQVAHVALTPLAIAALPWGVTRLVRGDGDRDEPDDGVLFLAVVAAALWFAVPMFGLACSFRYAAATFVVPVSIAVWYLVWLRRVSAGGGGRVLAGLAIGGVLAGGSTVPVALGTIVVAAMMLRGARRRIQIAALAGLTLGCALAVVSEWTPLVLHLRLHEFEVALRSLLAQLRVCGWVGAVMAALWLAHNAYASLHGRAPRTLPVAALDAVLRALGLGLVLGALALTTEDIGSFQCVAAGVAVATIAATVIVALVHGRRARIAVVVVIVLVEAKMLSGTLRTLVRARAAYVARLALLTAAPPATVAVIPAYPRLSTDFFFGEDFRTSARRDRIATLRFGLRGVDLAPERRNVQSVPALAVHHEVADPAGFPAFYSADLATARDQFAAAVRARHQAGARLVADRFAIPDRPGVPVFAAWLDAEGRPAWWQLVQRRVDREGQIRLVPVGPGLAGDDDAPELTAMWAFDLATGAGQPLARGDDGVFRLRPARRLNAGLVACTRDRCVLCEVVGLF
ncbi:MAG TPA: hypothetical protein VGC42_25800 [Kofleriaceae bacterium]